MARNEKLRGLSCPSCAGLLDGAASLDGDHKPKPGDLGVCLNCGAWLIFTEDFNLRVMTDDEKVDMSTDERGQQERVARYIKWWRSRRH